MSVHGRTTEYLDGALDADEEPAFLDHVGGCVECQRELHAEVQLRDREDALRSVTDAVPPDPHGRSGEYLDGALGDEAAAAFLDHVAGCGECQRELHAEVQLRDREDALRAAAATPRPEPVAPHPEPAVPRGEPAPRARAAGGDVVPLESARRRRVGWAAGAAVLLAAAGITLLIRSRPASTPSEPVALALGPSRSIEIRLSYGDAARHRPYDTMRGSASPGEPIGYQAIAAFERDGDCHGLATAEVLSRALDRADAHYQRCSTSPDLEADRAGLAVLRGQPDAALELTEGVLAAVPGHAVALWNRALALRDLRLELSAAAAFERVAELERSREPGWAQEASDRARALRAAIEPIRTAHDEVVRLGLDMLRGGPPLPGDLARRVPWRSRVMLHDAIRTATTGERLDELAPLAATLEGLAGTGLSRYLAQARAGLSPARTAAAADYLKIRDGQGAIDDHTWASWLALAARARADDLILGARIATGRLDGAPSAEQLAAATRDPWFELAVQLGRAKAASQAGRIEDGAARLAAIRAQCPPAASSYRCLQLEVELARLALDRHQPPEARQHALAAAATARQLAEWPQYGQALTLAGDAERFGGRFASARAYYEESGLARGLCGARNAAFTIAEMLFQGHRIAQAQQLVAGAPACDEAPSGVELTTLVRLLRTGHAVLDRAAVAAEIARARSAPDFRRDTAYLDYLAEWAALDGDPAARERLGRVMELARGVEGSIREKTIIAVHSALFADAGRRGAWAEALAVAARAHGVALPPRCVLAFGADDFRFAAVAIGSDGALGAGDYERDLVRPAEWLAPAPMRRQLDGCDEVSVLALSPWLGIGPVLDPQTPWHYVLGPARPPASGPRRHVVIADPATPPEAALAPLAPRTWPASAGLELVTGPAATPERALAAMSDATLIEIHSHATWLDRLDAPVLALSRGADGWSLGADKIRAARLTGAPVVVLADCAGGAAARYEHEAWGLPLAFRTAGASAVIASLAPIPDRDAASFFEAVTAELASGASPAVAVARVRAQRMQRDPTSWTRSVVVFQ